MSEFTGHSYEVVAWARDQRVLYFQTFGDYQGEWIMLAHDQADGGTYYVYKDYYGSCSGCDSYQAAFDSNEAVTKAKALEFAKDYPPFAEIPKATMLALAMNKTLGQVFPKNVRDTYSAISYSEVIRDMSTLVLLEEGFPVTVEDVITTNNQEIKRRAMDAYGAEEFVRDAGAEEIHRDGEDALVRVRDHVFLFVKDSSTPRRYLLRVPPDQTNVHAAKAWTFGMSEDEYRPVVET